MMRDERLTQGAPTPSVTHHSIFTVGSITVPGCRLLTLLALPLRSRGGRIGIGISVLCSRIHQNRPAPPHKQYIQHALGQQHTCIVGYVATGECDLFSKNGRAKWEKGGPG